MFAEILDGNITHYAGDTLCTPIRIYEGSKLFPSQYSLSLHDILYFAIMEPNQSFENAVVKKVYNSASEKDSNGNILLKLSSKDTEYLSGGNYYYTVKLRKNAKTSDEEIITIIKPTSFYIISDKQPGESYTDSSAGSGGESITEIKSFQDLRTINRMGLASKMLNIGDQFICDHKIFGKLTWDVIGIDQDRPADKQLTHTITLQLHDSLPSIFEFDAAEPNNPNTAISSFGSNDWSTSNIRQYLNADKTTWWNPQTSYDMTPSYVSKTGFLYGIEEDFLSAIGEVTKTTRYSLNTAAITSTEKIFLPSITEISGEFNNGVVEGQLYEYYNKRLSSNRIKYYKDVATAYWLRSADVNMLVNSPMYVSSNGLIDKAFAKNKNGIAPICCIV